jgi:Xaa-Pro aminopeptidase
MELVNHTMERAPFAHLDAERRYYLSWRELDDAVRAALGGARRIAMEYSPGNAIPYVAHVDAGTIEKIRSWGIEVVSSADLVAHFLARWTREQVDGHRRTAEALIAVKDQAFALIADRVRSGRTITEFEVVEFMNGQFRKRGLVADDGPICAVDANAGGPHYEPTAANSASIERGQLVLLDIWAKEIGEDSVYADITWTGFTGNNVPTKMVEVFEIVRRARDRAVEFANERLAGGAALHAYEIDDACREVIAKAGYGDRFIHRTGHSIGTAVHGVGPNIDNLETQDQRRLEDGMCFSIEPGIYLPEFGIRSEIDVLIENGRAVVTTLPLQTEIARLLA